MNVTGTSLTLFLFFILSLEYTPLYSQYTVVGDYLKQTKDYAALYRGEIEEPYNPYIYKTTPYYKSEEFVKSELYYDGRYYPDQLMRINLYKEQVVILNPQKQSIVLDLRRFEKALLHGKEIIKYNPAEKSGLKRGLYISLYKGKNVFLLSKEKQTLRALSSHIEYVFNPGVHYYIYYEDKYYTVNNKKSFIRIFPDFKKEINQYAKKEKLDFKKSKESSLIDLGKLCDQLINDQNHSE